MKDTLMLWSNSQCVELEAIGEENIALLKELEKRIRMYNDLRLRDMQIGFVGEDDRFSLVFGR